MKKNVNLVSVITTIIILICGVWLSNQLVVKTTGIVLTVSGNEDERLQLYYDNLRSGPDFFEEVYSEFRNLSNSQYSTLFICIPKERMGKIRLDYDFSETLTISNLQIRTGPFIICHMDAEKILENFSCKNGVSASILQNDLTFFSSESDPYIYSEYLNIDLIEINTIIYRILAFVWICFILKGVLHILKNLLNNKFKVKDIDTGVMCVSALSFMLFVYAPLEMYFTNQDDFWFDIRTLLPISLGVFGIGIVIGVLVLIILNNGERRKYKAVTIILFILLITSYIQGNFLLNGLPPLDGTNIDWELYVPERIISLFVWLGISIGVIVLLKKIGFSMLSKGIKLISICLTGMLSISLITVCITSKGYQIKETLVATKKNEFEMSRDTNFIILVLDAIDGWTFSNMLETHPEYKTVFKDFTYYNNTVCAYPYTKHSIPFILTGDWYENEELFDDYVAKSINNSKLLSSLEDQEYKLGIYDADLNLTSQGKNERFENMVSNKTQIESIYQFAGAMIQLAGIKYAPYELKRFCYNSPNKFDELKSADDKTGDLFFEWNNITFYKECLSESITFTDDKVFKFIHLEGAHVPYQYDEHLNIIENATYQGNIEGSMTMTQAYLNMLRENNAYNNSVIIIMSDHGYDETTGAQGRQNPILFVKGINESHEMKISAAPISYDDLQEAFLRLLSGKMDDQIFDYHEGDQRERRYLWYEYLNDRHMVEYIQTGEARELSTLIPTGREFNR